MPLSLEIVTPDGVAWKGENVDSVTLPTANGEIQILPSHIPLVTILKAGEIVVVSSGKSESLAVSDGYARIMGDCVSVLAEDAINIEEVNLEDAEKAHQQAIKAMQEELAKSTIDEEEIRRLEAMARFSIAQKLAKNNRH